MLAQLDRAAALGGLLLVPALIALLAFRWNVFLRQKSLHYRLSRLLALTWSGQFFNSLLPGSTGGDVVKFVEICRAFPERRPDATASVVADRLVALLALLGLAALGFAQNESAAAATLLRAASLPGWLWLAAAGALIAFLVGAGILLRSRLWLERALRLFHSLRTALRPDRYLAAGLGLAFAAHLASVAIFCLFAKALGLNLGFGAAILIVPAVLSASLLPITVNGHGVRELMLVTLLPSFGVIPPAGSSIATLVFALSTCLVCSDLVWSVPGGGAYLWLRRQPPDA